MVYPVWKLGLIEIYQIPPNSTNLPVKAPSYASLKDTLSNPAQSQKASSKSHIIEYRG